MGNEGYKPTGILLFWLTVNVQDCLLSMVLFD